MTSILPPGRSAWDVIGQSIGSNISQNLPGAVQQGFQRQTGLNAIDQLQNELKNANGDISKILPAIAKAYTLNPSLERSGIAEKFIPLAQRQGLPGTNPAGKTTPSGHPLQQNEQTGEQTPVSFTDLVQPRPNMVQNPQGVTDYQLPFGPEEFAQARNRARQTGLMPEIEDRIIKDMEEYNKVSQQRRDVELQNYQQQQLQRQHTLQNQALFEKYITEHDPEFSQNPDELELAIKASEKYQNEPSFAARNAKVKEELRPYQAAKKGLEKVLERPLFGMSKDRQNIASNRAKYMVEHGQKPALQLMIAKAGHGDVEEAQLLNPLSESYENRLNEFRKFVNPTEYIKSIDPESPEFKEESERGKNILESQKNRMIDFLADSIEPGKDYNHPGTNLLLTRYHLMQKGLNWEDAGTVIDSAIQKGKVKLDPQQTIDHVKLGYAPLSGDSYMDTILNHILFPITGRQ